MWADSGMSMNLSALALQHAMKDGLYRLVTMPSERGTSVIEGLASLLSGWRLPLRSGLPGTSSPHLRPTYFPSATHLRALISSYAGQG